MTKYEAVKIFEEKKVRSIWDAEQDKWYFSVVDTVEALTYSSNPQVYWRVLKKRLLAEGNQTVTICNGFKMLATDGKMRMTDVVDTEQLFRIIQSVPSSKAEPFKMWLAQIATERLDEIQNPEGQQFATLTDIITKTWSGKTTKEYKSLKGLTKESLRDNMTNKELVLNMLAELSTKEITAVVNPKEFDEHKDVARRGGNVAKEARLQLESETQQAVVTSQNAKSLKMSTKNMGIEKYDNND